MGAPQKNAAKRKWLNRSPRYRHLREDDNLVRVRAGSLSEPFEGRYRDISMTGLYLVARRPQESLKVGDIVEVSIPAPGTTPEDPKLIVARARIVRSDGEREFSLRFEVMADDVRKLLEQSLAIGFERARIAPFVEAAENTKSFFKSRLGMLIALVVTAILGWAILTWITAPRGNYDPERGTPWGQRRFF